MNSPLSEMTIPVQSGAIVPLLLMIPNVIWFLFPKANDREPQTVPRLLAIVENIGRLAIMLVPFFYALNMNRKYSTVIAIGMTTTLTIYYACWARYFRGERLAELLRTPLGGIPIPMATTPTTFLILSAYLMESWLMLGASVIFGIAHIWVSARPSKP